ncbi:hypothetical protein FB567DRAFT_574881 [Paraphoma chrysanthemicola]|uniref:Uncharacterized protein n=1 Tax=Paraphoma chrysanthemicola TaxID=798071 RepID=A0A8K0W4M8_9PLEO|nr:hypothetical protein FB567DRAFT_574881 [Paraphoma chrysanthemicola]
MLRLINNPEPYDHAAATQRHNLHIATLLPLPPTPSPEYAPLTPAFACGWLKLPLELKTLILHHTLVSSTGIQTYHEHAYINDTLEATRYITLAAVLRKHLAMGDGIARLAREVYYTHNVFIVKTTSVGLRYRICLPPHSLRSMIRRLEIKIYLSHGNWAVLQRLAVGAYGFSGARYVTVHVRWPESPNPAYFGLTPESRATWEGVVFGCAGQVVFEEVQEDKRAWVERYLAGKGTGMGDVEEWIRGVVKFAGDEEGGDGIANQVIST